MGDWIWSGKAGVVLGAVVLVVLLAPMLAWHFWKYGTGNAKRLAGGVAACFYTAALVTYTLFPLPPRTAAYCATHRIKNPPSLLPGEFIGRIAERTAGLPLWQVLTSFHVLQVVFNVVLFVPWGILARRWLNLPLWAAVASGFLGSLAIEMVQYTALFGWFPCRYRYSDPDDLLMNTLGALVGALLAPAVLWWMPRSQLLEAARLDPRPVTIWRRWAGMVVDAALWVFVLLTCLLLWWLGCHLAGRSPVPSLAVRLVSGLVATLVVFVWPAWEGTGASAGQAAAWLAPRWRDADGGWNWGSRTRRLARACLVPVLVTACLASVWLAPVALVLLVAALASVPLTRGHRGLSTALFGADLVDIRAVATVDGWGISEDDPHEVHMQ